VKKILATPYKKYSLTLARQSLETLAVSCISRPIFTFLKCWFRTDRSYGSYME